MYITDFAIGENHCCPNHVILTLNNVKGKNLIFRFFVASLLRMTNAYSYIKNDSR